MTEKRNLTEALKKYFGFDTFKGDQERIIRLSRTCWTAMILSC